MNITTRRLAFASVAALTAGASLGAVTALESTPAPEQVVLSAASGPATSGSSSAAPRSMEPPTAPATATTTTAPAAAAGTDPEAIITTAEPAASAPEAPAQVAHDQDPAPAPEVQAPVELAEPDPQAEPEPDVVYPWAANSEADGPLTATTIGEAFDGDVMVCTVRIDNTGDPVTRRLAVNFFTPGGEHMVDMTSSEWAIPAGSITVEHTAPGSFGPAIDGSFTCSPSWVPLDGDGEATSAS